MDSKKDLQLHANDSKDAEIAAEHDEYRAHGVNRVDLDAEFGGHENRMKIQKSLLRKVDLRMFVLVVIYILNYVCRAPPNSVCLSSELSQADPPFAQIDRNNASAARLRGFERDLHLSQEQFDTLLSILYVGYILMQIPSYVVLPSELAPNAYPLFSSETCF